LIDRPVFCCAQVEPKLRARAKEMTEAQRRITGDGAGPVHNLSHAIGRHVDLSRQLGGAHVERVEFFRQVLPGMDRDAQHENSPSDSQPSPKIRVTSSIPNSSEPRGGGRGCRRSRMKLNALR
jgi:hypothetical protein